MIYPFYLIISSISIISLYKPFLFTMENNINYKRMRLLISSSISERKKKLIELYFLIKAFYFKSRKENSSKKKSVIDYPFIEEG